MDDPALLDRLRAGAVAHAKEFSWDATAAGTLEVYERARGFMRESVA